jgi:hypothetical protein
MNSAQPTPAKTKRPDYQIFRDISDLCDLQKHGVVAFSGRSAAVAERWLDAPVQASIVRSTPAEMNDPASSADRRSR